MLSVANRLSRTQFTAVFKRGRRYHSEHFTVVFDGEYERPAGSVVVSKKVAKLAVARNRLRRRAYGVLESHITVDVKGAIIILFKTGSLAMSRLSMKQELSDLLAKIPKSR